MSVCPGTYAPPSAPLATPLCVYRLGISERTIVIVIVKIALHSCCTDVSINTLGAVFIPATYAHLYISAYFTSLHLVFNLLELYIIPIEPYIRVTMVKISCGVLVAFVVLCCCR